MMSINDTIGCVNHDCAKCKAQSAPVQEPVARQYQGRDGAWRDFISEKHYKDTLEDGSWPIRNLYTTPPAQPAVPLTDEQITEGRRGAWNEVLDPFTAGVRFAEAAHGIAAAAPEKGQP
jgi:hypothetical protein